MTTEQAKELEIQIGTLDALLESQKSSHDTAFKHLTEVRGHLKNRHDEILKSGRPFTMADQELEDQQISDAKESFAKQIGQVDKLQKELVEKTSELLKVNGS
jgi:hypothetical protein